MKAAFARLAPRHKAMACLLAAAAAIFLLLAATRGANAQSACPSGRSPTVSWFLSNPDALDCVLRECEDDPGQFAKGRACINAQSAAFARMRDRYAAEARRRPPAVAPPVAPAVRSYRL